jgi:hypothetical protein
MTRKRRSGRDDTFLLSDASIGNKEMIEEVIQQCLLLS